MRLDRCVATNIMCIALHLILNAMKGLLECQKIAFFKSIKNLSKSIKIESKEFLLHFILRKNQKREVSYE